MRPGVGYDAPGDHRGGEERHPMLRLDRVRGLLCDHQGRRFEPAGRRWLAAGGAAAGERVEPAEAVSWLQRNSGQPCRVPVGVIGPRSAGARQMETAEAVGAGLAVLGLTVLCGGGEGVMEAVCRGVARAGGLSVGLLPGDDWQAANPYVGVPIATGIGVARNAVIARAAVALVAIGGGTGTLSEVAFGLQFGRPVFGLEGAPAVEGLVMLDDWPSLETALCRTVLAL
jgi:uncharacterized protein (TIGR00725 family)